MVISKLLRTTL
uniref:Uncharacterized protein n=1 Tax=Anguilla anguilla TaxID=7936 RepID=A0A0E9V7V6_ANGAN